MSDIPDMLKCKDISWLRTHQVGQYHLQDLNMHILSYWEYFILLMLFVLRIYLSSIIEEKGFKAPFLIIYKAPWFKKKIK